MPGHFLIQDTETRATQALVAGSGHVRAIEAAQSHKPPASREPVQKGYDTWPARHRMQRAQSQPQSLLGARRTQSAPARDMERPDLAGLRDKARAAGRTLIAFKDPPAMPRRGRWLELIAKTSPPSVDASNDVWVDWAARRLPSLFAPQLDDAVPPALQRQVSIASQLVSWTLCMPASRDHTCTRIALICAVFGEPRFAPDHDFLPTLCTWLAYDEQDHSFLADLAAINAHQRTFNNAAQCQTFCAALSAAKEFTGSAFVPTLVAQLATYARGGSRQKQSDLENFRLAQIYSCLAQRMPFGHGHRWQLLRRLYTAMRHQQGQGLATVRQLVFLTLPPGMSSAQDRAIKDLSRALDARADGHTDRLIYQLVLRTRGSINPQGWLTCLSALKFSATTTDLHSHS